MRWCVNMSAVPPGGGSVSVPACVASVPRARRPNTSSVTWPTKVRRFTIVDRGLADFGSRTVDYKAWALFVVSLVARKCRGVSPTVVFARPGMSAKIYDTL